jgi:hypothetical protein
MLSSGWNSDLTDSTYNFGVFLRGGIFYWVTPDKWSFTLSGGGLIPFAGSPWRFAGLAEALINGHYKKSYAGLGLGISSKSQSLTSSGVDIVAQLGTNVFQTWTKFGSLFVEFRAPLGRNFQYNHRFGLGFRILF